MIGTAGASLGKWARLIDANDADPALTINQRGSGDILSMESGGVEVAKFDNSGNLVFTGSITVDFGDDAGLAMGAGDDADLRYSTQDANAKMMQWGLPHVDEDANNVAVLVLMDRDLVGTDISSNLDLSGTTEPTLAVINEAGNAGIIIGGATIKSNTGSLTIDGDDGLILQTSGTKSVEVKETLILGTGEAAIGAKTGDVLRAPDHPGGTDTDEDGADITIAAGLGTGDGDAGTIIFQLPEVVGTGTTVQTRATVLTMDMAASTTDMAFTFTPNTTVSSSGTLTINAFTLGGSITGGSNTITGIGDITVTDAAGPSILNEAATSSNPTLIPDRAEGDTGIGWASDTIHIVLGGASEYKLAVDEFVIGSGDGGIVLVGDITIRPPNLASGAGDDNVAGADFFIKGALGRGTGDVGQIIFQTAQVAAADTVQTYETILTLDEDLATFSKAVDMGVWLFSGVALQAETDALIIAARSADNNFITFNARDSSVGAIEVCRLAGAADPYFRVGRDDTGVATGAVTDMLWLQAGAGSSNESAGFGYGISILLGNDASEVEERVSIDFVLVTATNGSEDARIDFNVMGGGAAPSRALSVLNDSVQVVSSVFITEQASALADVVGDGQFWVESSAPNEPWFTDDAGNDIFIGQGDYAGIYRAENSGATTINLRHSWELIDVFDTDMPENISNGANGSDDITIGATGVYKVEFSMAAAGGGANKVYAISVFVLETSASAITSSNEANPVSVLATGHGFTTGNKVKITGVTTATILNDRIFEVTRTDDNNFTLQEDNSGNVDGTGIGLGTGGTATIVTELKEVHADRKFAAADVGAISAGALVSLTASKTMELFVKNTTDSTDITFEDIQFMMQRVG